MCVTVWAQSRMGRPPVARDFNPGRTRPRSPIPQEERETEGEVAGRGRSGWNLIQPAFPRGLARRWRPPPRSDAGAKPKDSGARGGVVAWERPPVGPV